MIIVAIQAVASIVCAIAESMGLKDKDETPEKKPEDFDSTAAYSSGTEPRIVSDSMAESLKKIYPEMTEESIYEKLNDMSSLLSQI